MGLYGFYFFELMKSLKSLKDNPLDGDDLDAYK